MTGIHGRLSRGKFSVGNDLTFQNDNLAFFIFSQNKLGKEKKNPDKYSISGLEESFPTY
jgi:hypothetical protein